MTDKNERSPREVTKSFMPTDPGGPATGVLPQWLGYEARRLGTLSLVSPALILAAFAGLAALMGLTGSTDRQVAGTLVAALEAGLPLAAGVVAATVVAAEPAVDLHLTLRTRYRTTILRRLATLVLWTSLVSLLWTLVLRLTGQWELWMPVSLVLVEGQLAWLAPLVWLVALGSFLSLLLRSRAASGAVLGGLWVFEHVLGGLMFGHDWLSRFFLFATTYTLDDLGVDWWLGNRLTLVLSALALTAGVVLLLGRTERLATGGDE